jgi:DNA 3'-phosphatase
MSSNYFSGLKFALLDFSKGQREILEKNIAAAGGAVMMMCPKPAPIFSRKVELSPLPADLTHIVTENKDITIEQLRSKLSCPDISDSVKVVHASWLRDCLRGNALLGGSCYMIVPTEGKAEKEKENSKQNAHESEPPLKRVRTEPASSSSSQPIGVINMASRFEPVFGVWAEFGPTTMYKFYDSTTHDRQTTEGYSGKTSVDNDTAMESVGNDLQMVGFDLDWTLIKPKVGCGKGKVFPIDEDDWQMWHPSVIPKLRELHSNGTSLAIISNQQRIGQCKISRESVQRKIDKIIERIGVPVDYICATTDDIFRKPLTGN